MKRILTKKGFTLIELVVILVIIIAFALLLRSTGFKSLVEDEKQLLCKVNLDQFGKSFAMYRADYGGNRRHPDANGAYFMGRLYKVELLIRSKVYLCPDTSDTNEGIDLGKSSGLAPEHISYAGRKNKNHAKYPGIFKPFRQTTLTTIVSDDFEATPNHEDGDVTIFLFLDGHVDQERVSNGGEKKIFLLSDPLSN